MEAAKTAYFRLKEIHHSTVHSISINAVNFVGAVGEQQGEFRVLIVQSHLNQSIKSYLGIDQWKSWIVMPFALSV